MMPQILSREYINELKTISRELDRLPQMSWRMVNEINLPILFVHNDLSIRINDKAMKVFRLQDRNIQISDILSKDDLDLFSKKIENNINFIGEILSFNNGMNEPLSFKIFSGRNEAGSILICFPVW